MRRQIHRDPVDWNAWLAKQAMAEYVLDFAAELLAAELAFSKDRARRLIVVSVRRLDDA